MDHDMIIGLAIGACLGAVSGLYLRSLVKRVRAKLIDRFENWIDASMPGG